MDAITDGRLNASIEVVVSNNADATGLDRARRGGIRAAHVDHRGWPSRDDYDRHLVDVLRAADVGLVCLAGFMRRVGAPLIEAFPNAIVNVHPSLLPSFPGLDAQGQAVSHGVKASGVTVHLVTRELDSGPIILQQPVEVLDDDTADSLAARILVEEHRLYPEAVRILLEDEWFLSGRRFLRRDGRSRLDPGVQGCA
jgi:phosphoribosylglycinamide formyltransferase-1